QGLRFTAVFAGDRCVAVAGWRIIANTSATRKMYVDDLSTAESERSLGYGRMLLDALHERAVKAGCRFLDLDSGVQRFDAHRFYLRERLDIVAHHFPQRSRAAGRRAAGPPPPHVSPAPVASACASGWLSSRTASHDASEPQAAARPEPPRRT